MAGLAPPEGSAVTVGLKDVLSEALIGEVLEAMPRWQNVPGQILRKEFEYILDNVVLKQASKAGEGRRAKDLPAAELQQALRPVLQDADTEAFFACCVWADLQQELRKQAPRVLGDMGRGVWDTKIGTK